MSTNDHRKCAKCGKTRSEDRTVTYHRFPNPGKANITKARAWAKYCWPDQNWTSEESLETLYKSNKVLCGRHFSLPQFYDNCRQKLSKFAVPDEKIMIELLENKENLYTQTEQEPNVNVATASQSETRHIGVHTCRAINDSGCSLANQIKITNKQKGELAAEAHATASLLRKFDRLFDSLNADTPDLRGGKKYCTNMSPTSPHHDFFKDVKVFIRDLKYLGTRSNPPSQEGCRSLSNVTLTKGSFLFPYSQIFSNIFKKTCF